ncbi:MAG: ARPP-1 family domain-containing protein [Candidatus Kapaibacterium sp.]
MKNSTRFLKLGALAAFAVFSAIFVFVNALAQQGASEYSYSNPYTYKNLTIYIIRGKDHIPKRSYLTLEQAMERKLVTVFETGSVNELALENLSDNEAIFIQSGDIVKGGRQDRTLAFDMIVPPKSGKLPINSFCVEHGRWSGRANESAGAFASSADMIPSKGIKLAAKYKNSQGDVWDKVAIAEGMLSTNAAGGAVLAPESSTSLQLSIENKHVRDTTNGYLKKLASAVDGKDDAIGFVFFINGKLNSADVYGSHDLFLRLWKKLLKASSTEAVSDLGEKNYPAASLDDFKTCIAETASAERSERTINPRTTMIVKDAPKSLLFETHDNVLAEVAHRNYLTKDEGASAPKQELERE